MIKGYQKLTLLDYPGKMASIVFTGGCNFRCPYCHNMDIAQNKGEDVLEEEFFNHLKKRKNVLEGVVVTGGEPLIRENIKDFIRKIKELGYAVKLDTNGSFPDRLKELVAEHLVDYVAMDVKNSLKKYPTTVLNGFTGVDKIKESIDFLKQNNLPYEFRTTVCKELFEEEDFEEIGKMVQGAEVIYLQAFKKSEGVTGGDFTPPTQEEMQKYQQILSKYAKNAKIRE